MMRSLGTVLILLSVLQLTPAFGQDCPGPYLVMIVAANRLATDALSKCFRRSPYGHSSSLEAAEAFSTDHLIGTEQEFKIEASLSYEDRESCRQYFADPTRLRVEHVLIYGNRKKPGYKPEFGPGGTVTNLESETCLAASI
jgi:hypothetical protein